MNRDIVKPNPFPSIWQIVDTYGIRVLQNNGAKPTRLLVSLSLAKRLAAELARDCYEITHGTVPIVKLGICTDFMGMGARIVPDAEIHDGEFDIDYVPCEHRQYSGRRGPDQTGDFYTRMRERCWRMYEEVFGESFFY